MKVTLAIPPDFDDFQLQVAIGLVVHLASVSHYIPRETVLSLNGKEFSVDDCDTLADFKARIGKG